MSKKQIIVLLVVVASASFLFGAKTAKKKLKWPYLSAKWSEPAKITELGLACLKSEFRSAEIADKSIVVNRKVQDKYKRVKQVPVILIDRIVIWPSSEFIEVTAEIRAFTKKTKIAKGDLLETCAATSLYFHKKIHRRFNRKKTPHCPLIITIRRNGKLVARQRRDGSIKTVLD